MVSQRVLIGSIVAALVILGGATTAVAAPQEALRAEETYVTAQLQTESCLESWGANEGAGPKEAAITGVASFGLRVRVSLPYAYTVKRDGESIFADTASEAVYDVTVFGPRRISGDEISPCEPRS